ncbi:MAG: hypothetical protein K0A90_09405, partial [Methanosarcinaceae archaeon]|nr:hypothetical protein [Methanosarcinaceae archaeon]
SLLISFIFSSVNAQAPMPRRPSFRIVSIIFNPPIINWMFYVKGLSINLAIGQRSLIAFFQIT